MKFEEELAESLIEKHNLTRQSYYMWKRNGVIPKMYFKEYTKQKLSNGLTIRDNRIKHGLSTIGLVEAIGTFCGVFTTDQSIRDWEKGKQKPTRTFLVALEKYFKHLDEQKNEQRR